MSIKYTRSTLHKIEQVFNELNFRIRYEKGSFQSGYCIVMDRNVVVINKFFESKARINVLLDILSQLPIDISLLSSQSIDVLAQGGLTMFAEQAA